MRCLGSQERRAIGVDRYIPQILTSDHVCMVLVPCSVRTLTICNECMCLSRCASHNGAVSLILQCPSRVTMPSCFSTPQRQTLTLTRLKIPIPSYQSFNRPPSPLPPPHPSPSSPPSSPPSPSPPPHSADSHPPSAPPSPFPRAHPTREP